jgi:hypothetical protein
MQHQADGQAAQVLLKIFLFGCLTLEQQSI